MYHTWMLWVITSPSVFVCVFFWGGVWISHVGQIFPRGAAAWVKLITTFQLDTLVYKRSAGMRHFLGGGFKLSFIITSTWVKWSNLTSICFFKGVVQPPTISWWLIGCLGWWFRILGVPLRIPIASIFGDPNHQLKPPIMWPLNPIGSMYGIFTYIYLHIYLHLP